MEKWKDLNLNLRIQVISTVLRLEQISSEVLKSIFRIFNNSTKTLGHKSSALSFKTKVDLLHDLGELEPLEYSHLIKLMEIRNQFTHNHNVISFESLDNYDDQINKYLMKHCPDNLKNESNREIKLHKTFDHLFMLTYGKLAQISIEYSEGLKTQIRKFVNDKTVENIDNIFEESLAKYMKQRISKIGLPDINDEIRNFFLQLKIDMLSYSSKELSEVNATDSILYKPKESIEKILEKAKIKEPNIASFRASNKIENSEKKQGHGLHYTDKQKDELLIWAKNCKPDKLELKLDDKVTVTNVGRCLNSLVSMIEEKPDHFTIPFWYKNIEEIKNALNKSN